LLLAAKINESHVALVVQKDGEESYAEKGILSLIRPTNQSQNIFASLLEFFTHEWELTLGDLFAAEWGVFVALGFKLTTTPSQVAFHFRRLMKVLGWKTRAYLGPEMFDQWQTSLTDEESRRKDREKRKELRRNKQERNLLQLELHRQQETESMQDPTTSVWQAQSIEKTSEEAQVSGDETPLAAAVSQTKKGATLSLLNRFAMKRQSGIDKVVSKAMSNGSNHDKRKIAISTRQRGAAHRAEVKDGSESQDSSLGIVSDDEIG